MGQTRKARAVRDSAARKIGRHCHVSMAFARSELMDFVGMLLKDKKNAARLAAQLDLTAEEIALLLGSSQGTKKVQNIFEEAMRIRSQEEIEEIELAWRKSSQPSLNEMSRSIGQMLSVKNDEPRSSVPAIQGDRISIDSSSGLDPRPSGQAAKEQGERAG